MASPERLRAVRGATTVAADTEADIRAAVSELLLGLTEANAIAPADVCAAFFTVTPDLTAVSVAKVARTALAWEGVPMVCALEPPVRGLPDLCVRVMVQYYGGVPVPRPVYLRGAAVLRPDWSVGAP